MLAELSTNTLNWSAIIGFCSLNNESMYEGFPSNPNIF